MTKRASPKLTPTAAHWGNFLVESEDNKLLAVHNYDDDTHPSAIGQSLLNALDPNARIDQPMVRRGYLEHGAKSDGRMRGREPFVAVSWDTAFELAANALKNVKEQYGNEAIYGGSYGWASAGRFHHAQSQMHRFLNKFGGYTASDRTYSAAAGEVLLPRILGSDLYILFLHTPPWKDVLSDGELVVCFGGVPMKNLQVAMGGVGSHSAPDQMKQCRERGLRVINISPIKADLPDYVDAEWIPIRPNTDAAVLLAICYTLVDEELVDHDFLDRYTVGYEKFEHYLLGKADGERKDTEWAERISTVPADTIRSLARSMAKKRTFIPMGWSIQRAEHGEQPYWLGVVLLSMLGQMGLKGAGNGFGVGSIHTISFMGRRVLPFKWGTFPQGENPVDSVIPVARISDMLLHPGESYHYDGKTPTYPDIKLIYWAGGNPYHHHQDLNRLKKAWSRPETIIVNDPFWTATARHADIVFPATTSLERNDVGFNTFDPYITPMPQAVEAYAQSKNDYDIFRGLAERLGVEKAFSEGKNESDWLKYIFAESKTAAQASNVTIPDYEQFWQSDHISVADQIEDVELILEAFRRDPHANPLGTPSGKIEIYSETIASFNYGDCPGHPVWLDKQEWLGGPLAKRFPLHLISGQPAARLHSQYDHSVVSRATKINGREPMTMHPKDAEERGITEGSIVRIFNERGACLAGVVFSDQMRREVIQLATGAWYDPQDTDDGLGLCIHGNPNVLTRDVGSSKLGQGPSAHSCLVEVEKYEGPEFPVRVFDPPEIIRNS
jgi:biotin/methionine sulfoxide reductase